MHKLLLRQLKRHVGVLDAIPPNWRAFIDAVNESYHQADADRALLEHSLELSSQELLERNRQLQQDLAERQRKEAALRQAEEERLKLQDEIIRMQAAALEQLSTPLIPITDDILVMPLIGTIDSRRAQKMTETLLQGLATHQARTAILDITGVPVVDIEVAQGFLRAARAAQLLGARVVLTGIRPEVAQTLVGIGADLRDIVTYSTLQNGISAATALH
jgi:anti-anti-sigma regulatory factor